VRRRLVAFGIALLVQGAYVVGCTDGTTPDCSDAATHCGPDVDATTERIEAALPESAPPADAPIDSTPADATPPDADLDAGDGG
jgi:hypothetical protein